MSELLSCFNNIVDNNFQAIENMKRKYGIIKELVPNTDSAKVVVRIYDLDNEADEDDDNTLTLLNKTGGKLEEGDHVWVHYWKSITDGYVAIKIGKQRIKKNKIRLSIERAITVCDDEEVLKNMTENDLHYFEIANKISLSHGNSVSLPCVGGYLAAYYPCLMDLPSRINNDTVGSNDFKNFILGLSSSLFVKKMTIPFAIRTTRGFVYTDYYFPPNHPFEGFNVYEYKIDIYTMERFDNVWYYKPAIYRRRLIGENSYTDWLLFDQPSDSIYISSINDLQNAGFTLVYDDISLYEECNLPYPEAGYVRRPYYPYGNVHGALVFRLLGAGIIPGVASGLDIIFTKFIDNLRDCEQYWKDMYFGFATRDEKDYVRQLLTKTETPPY